mmetsp:Transcript_26683/g.53366  ORF Transcript_26683/g.53366 Transcript_26683/m.53366 type:complete len:224 (+) Transcript_26683:78-749(+)
MRRMAAAGSRQNVLGPLYPGIGECVVLRLCGRRLCGRPFLGGARRLGRQFLLEWRPRQFEVLGPIDHLGFRPMLARLGVGFGGERFWVNLEPLDLNLDDVIVPRLEILHLGFHYHGRHLVAVFPENADKPHGEVGVPQRTEVRAPWRRHKTHKPTTNHVLAHLTAQLGRDRQAVEGRHDAATDIQFERLLERGIELADFHQLVGLPGHFDEDASQPLITKRRF